MATVGAVYTQYRYVRSPSDILGNLRSTETAKAKPPLTEDKRVWASLIKTPSEVIEELFEEGERRDPDRKKDWVGLVDGNAHQIRHLEQYARERRLTLTVIMDFIHVTEYVWNAAWCFYKEGDPLVENWVNERLLRILKGECVQVAAGMRRSASRRKLDAGGRKAVDKCADYLLNHKKYLKYDEYLSKGNPIATLDRTQLNENWPQLNENERRFRPLDAIK